jgi:hypothetical protein
LSDDEAFYKRWSRRKVAEAEKPKQPATSAFAPLPEVEDEGGEAEIAVAEDGTTALPAEAVGDGPAEAVGDGDVASDQKEGDTTEVPSPEADLPDVETLNYESDYHGFMAEGVSEDLRNRALRRLWRSNPILANIDGLNDYDEDFTDAALVKPGMKTAFDAIRGYASDKGDAEEDEDTTSVATAEAEAEVDAEAEMESGDEENQALEDEANAAERGEDKTDKTTNGNV